MARRPTCWKKSVKLQVEKLERKCRYCKTHQSARGFDKHQAWCKKTWIIRQEYRLHNHSITNQLQPASVILGLGQERSGALSSSIAS